MAEEERNIRGEIASDIKRDSEEDIKDGIHHLALRLHRLYQQRREKNAQDRTPSEVNISIKMEGGTKVEIKETKKEAPGHRKGLRQPLPRRSSRSNNADVHAMLGSNAKKFDWAKSLRVGTEPAIINRKVERSYQAKMPSYDRGFRMNLNMDNTRRNLASASRLTEGKTGLNNKVLALGWKC